MPSEFVLPRNQLNFFVSKTSRKTTIDESVR